MKIAKKVIALSLSLIMIAGSLQFAFGSDVKINVTAYPDIDVVLSTGTTSYNTTNFEKDIKNALANYGVPENKIKVSKIESSTSDIQTSFSWRQDLSSSIGSISLTNGGQNIAMRGNTRNAGKNAVYCVEENVTVNGTTTTQPISKANQEFQLDYSINFGDSFNSAGMLLRTKKEGNYLSGYMLSFNYRGAFQTGYNGSVWKYRWYIGSNSSNMTQGTVSSSNYNTIEKVADLSINTSGTLNVKITSDSIIFSGAGLSKPYTVAIDSTFAQNYCGYGYGFFSDHYSHNCSSIGQFNLTAINLTKTTVKTVTEVLKAPEWRDNTLRLLVNVNDYEEVSLNNAASRTELLSKLKNDNIHYIMLGTSANKTQSESLITDNDGKGKFIYNNQGTPLNSIADYVKQFINNQPTEDIVIVGMPTNIVVTPAEATVNTANAAFPNGKWFIEHNPNYYNNSQGESNYNNKYQSDFVLTFDKTGEYKIYYEDELIKTVYVHRKPVAQFNMAYTRKTKTLTYTDTSYDLDSQTEDYDGIVERKWQYKKSTDKNYTDGKLTTVEDGVSYIVQLQVKDKQGVWSDIASVTLDASASTPIPPIAQFTASSNNLSKYDTLKLTDTSYDPRGYDILTYKWTLYDENDRVLKTSISATPMQLDLLELGEGTYKIGLIVGNEKYNSDEFIRQIIVYPDTVAPNILSISRTPDENSDWFNGTLDITIEAEDKESGIKTYSCDYEDYTLNGNVLTFNSLPSNKELVLNVIDNDNNKTSRTIKVENFDFTSPKISNELSTNDYTNGDIVVTLSNDENESGFDGYYFNNEKINGNTITFTKNGNYEIIAKDKVGNASSKTITIDKIDKDIPTNLIISIDNLTFAKGELTFNVSASDYSSLKYKLEKLNAGKKGNNNQLLAFAFTDTDWQDSDEFTIDENGDYKLSVRDMAGNVATKEFTVNNIDNEAPVVELKDVTTPFYTNTQKTIKFNITDNMSGVASVNTSCDNDNSSFDNDELTLGLGTTNISIKVTDKVGNEETYTFGPFIYDIEEPIDFNATQRANNNNITVDLDFETKDTLSGLKGYSYVIDEEDITEPDSEIETSSNKIILDVDYAGKMLHIKAFDNAGNETATKHLRLVGLNYQRIGKDAKQGTTPILVEQEATNFDVVVPLSLPVDMDGYGVVTTSDSAKIINKSFGPIQVKDIDLEEKDWELISYDSDKTTLKVGSNKIGFKIDDVKTIDKAFDFVTSEDWVIDGNNNNKVIEYDAVLSPVRDEIKNINAIDTIFTIDWYEEEQQVVPIVSTTYKVGDKLSKSLTGLGNFEFTCVEENNNEYWFICDKIVSNQMFNSSLNKGNNYATSDLKTYVDSLGVEGLTIPTKAQLEKWYLNRSERIAQYNGTNTNYWTSSAYPNSAYDAYDVDSDGDIIGYDVDITLGVRPCFAITK